MVLLDRISRWFQSCPRPRRARRHFGLRIDLLEDRVLLTAPPILVQYSASQYTASELYSPESAEVHTPDGEAVADGTKSISFVVNRSGDGWSVSANVLTTILVTGNRVKVSQHFQFSYTGRNGPTLIPHFATDLTSEYAVKVFLAAELYTTYTADGTATISTSDDQGLLTQNYAGWTAFGSGGAVTGTQSVAVHDISTMVYQGADKYIEHDGAVYWLTQHTLRGQFASAMPFIPETSDNWSATLTVDAAVDLTFGLDEPGPGNVDVTSLRFTGTDETPSSELTVDWTYRNDQPNLQVPDQFTVRLYYSKDQVFDNGDVLIAATTDAANSPEDSGTVTFTFDKNGNAIVRKGAKSTARRVAPPSRKPKVGWLRPDPLHPYVLAVIDHGEHDSPFGENNQAAKLLPSIKIKKIDAENETKAGKFSTLMKESTFNLELGDGLGGKSYTIEYLRIGTALPGEKKEWTRFAEGQQDVIKGKHLLAGTFQFRAVVEIDGQKFTSELSSGPLTSKAKAENEIEVLFPKMFVPDLANEQPALIATLKDIWETMDKEILGEMDTMGGLAKKREASAWIAIDTHTGRMDIWDPSNPGRNYRVDTYPNGESIGGGRLPPLPQDQFDANTLSAKYVVAAFHTHPREFNIPFEPGTALRYTGPSKRENNGKNSDEYSLQLLTKALKIKFPGLVYDYIGDSAAGEALPAVYNGYKGYRTLTDYSNPSPVPNPKWDLGQLSSYAAIRRENLKK